MITSILHIRLHCDQYQHANFENFLFILQRPKKPTLFTQADSICAKHLPYHLEIT